MAKDDQFEFEFELALSIPTGRRDSQQEPQQEIEKREENDSAMLYEPCSEGESE